jgi:hypothetical protein
VEHANLARDILNAHGVTSTVTMRDAIRMHKLSQLDISDCIYHDVVFHKHPDLYNEFTTDVSILAAVTKKKTMTQSEATSVDELWEIVQREAQQATTTSDSSEDRKVLARELVQKFISTDGISPIPADWAIERKIASSSANPYDTYKIKYLPNNTTYTFDESEFIPF